ncbi:MAG: ROK family protein [Lachnospiraceae bacterium]
MYHIGIDLGGTNIAAGVVDENNRLLCKESVPTGLPKPPEAIAEEIHRLTRNMLASHGMSLQDICSIGIGIPGTVNKNSGVIEYANNFGFDNVPFLGMVEEYFTIPVYADNDAGAAAWGEYLAGAGMGCSSMAAVTLGTGVGGGIILDGKLLHGFNSAAGEIGHMVIERGGRACTCGRSGCLEAYASAEGKSSALVIFPIFGKKY